jgi:hypothetical protein
MEAVNNPFNNSHSTSQTATYFFNSLLGARYLLSQSGIAPANASGQQQPEYFRSFPTPKA